MNLSDALSTARNSLSQSALNSATIARNISGANEAGYARRTAVVGLVDDAGAMHAQIVRAANEGLRRIWIQSSSDKVRASTIEAGLNQIGRTMGTDLSGSPAERLRHFKSALQAYAASPAEPAHAYASFKSATDLARSLNEAANAVQTVRAQTDSDIQASVTKLNATLEKLAGLNAEISRAGSNDQSTPDLIDQRDRLVGEIAEEIGIRVIQRPANSIFIYADNGAVLLDREPREISFTGTLAFTANIQGEPIYFDGVDSTTQGSAMTLKSGRLAGLIELRDRTTTKYQSQLDEIARGLVNNFAETDQQATSGATVRPGLFVTSGFMDVPLSTSVTGLASSIAVNPAADPDMAGNPARIRDGGLAEPGSQRFVYNKSQAPDYSERINSLLSTFESSYSLRPESGLGAALSVDQLAVNSTGWLQEERQSAQQIAYDSSVMAATASDALQKNIGVDMDDQLERMLNIQHSYQASARMLSIVDELLSDLMRTLG